jgi:hypothetical protein
MTPASPYPRFQPRRRAVARFAASIAAVAIGLLCGPSVIDQAASTLGIQSHLGAMAEAAPPISVCVIDLTIYLPCPVGPGSTVRFECSTASVKCSPSSWKISIVDQPRNAVCLAQGCDTLRITLTSPDLTDGECWMRDSSVGWLRDANCNGIPDRDEPQPAGTITPASSGVPSTASAVLANVAMTGANASAGYITADKCSLLQAGPQTKSNGNYAVGATISNLSVIPVDADGRFCVYNQSAVHLIADVQGYFAPPAASGQQFTPATPARKLDTRAGGAAPVAAGLVTKVATGAAPGTSAVLVNVAMTDAAAAGYITADKCSVLKAGAQTKSNGNYEVGTAISNLSVVPVDADGSFCVFNLSAVHLVVDIQGSFAAPSASGLSFAPSVPTRKLDTRDSGAAPVAAGVVTKVTTGAAAGTSAVLVNVAMTGAATPGYITADKCSVLQPGPQTKSNGNYGIGSAISNLSVVPVDADGSFCVFNLTPVHLVVDIQGSFTPSGTQQFFPVTPKRVLDTRTD